MTEKQTYELWNYLQKMMKDYKAFYEKYNEPVYLELHDAYEDVSYEMVKILGSVPSDV